jgi:ribonuclease BN (tRNA processing enzyme)
MLITHDAGAAITQSQCGRAGELVLQVLGSGGPELAGGRASTSYLVWHKGKARLLVDLGPGAMLRFGETGARLDDLDLVAISHLHVDHAGDLPALIKVGYFTDRTTALPVAGPGAGGVFPGLTEWINGQFQPAGGSYRYLSGALDGSNGQFALKPVEIPPDGKQGATVLRTPDMRIDAIPVPHGAVPTLAYRVEIDHRVIVFGGDQNGSSPAFWRFAAGADLLVAHLAVPEKIGGPARALHATPSRIGEGAAQAQVRRLLLSHFMTRSEATLDENLALVRQRFDGGITLASDLACVAVEPAALRDLP